MNITNEARQRINDIAERNGGTITPEQVWTDAQDPSSPLHSYFPWDLETAARERWLEIGRKLIRGVRVVFKEERVVIKSVGYVRDPTVASDRQGYVSLARVRSDKDLSHEVLVAEFSRVAAALRRTLNIAKAMDMRDKVVAMLEQIELWTSEIRSSTDGQH